jgi:DivIVA domain-containing protein
LSLDRQTIEKKDFPIGRRGYDPEAVDAHLARLADELDTLQRSAQRRSGASLAQAASEQVRAIVEAAEQSAHAIEREAEEQASQIRSEAKRGAEQTEKDAVARSREHVARVGEQTSSLLQRVDAMETELGGLIESLRTGANRLNADLSLLETNMGDLYQAAGGTRGATPAEPPTASITVLEVEATEVAPEIAEEDEFGVPGEEEPPAAAAPPEPEATPAAERAARPAAPDGGDVEGARLIALNMALNGQSREETDRYLAENFDLADRDGLLDEVYASVGG